MDMTFDFLTPDASANLDSIAPGVTDIVSSEQQPGESWYDTLARAIPLLVATAQQKQLLDVQVQRAKAGLPPLNVAQYSAGAQVGLSSDTKTFLTWALVGLGGVYLLSRRGR